MHGLREYVLALACIFAVNPLPAFGPPTRGGSSADGDGRSV
jgi:hypothetical protein